MGNIKKEIEEILNRTRELSESKHGKKHKKIVESKEFKEGLKFLDPETIAFTRIQLRLFKSKDVAIIFNHIAYFTLSNKCNKKSQFFLKTRCPVTKAKIRSVKFKISNLSKEYGISIKHVYRIIKSLQNANVILVEQEKTVYNVGINVDNYLGILLCTYIYFHWGQDVFPKNWKREFSLPKLC